MSVLCQGNSDAARWCAANFPANAGSACTSPAAHGTGPYYTCGPGQKNPSMALCSRVCVNTATDPNNCGSCGRAAGLGQTCCSGNLVTLATDPNNCGACVNKAGPGQSCCSGSLVNTSTDPANCGSCGSACPAHNSCRGGQCTPTGCQELVIPSCNLATCPGADEGCYCLGKKGGENVCAGPWVGHCYLGNCNSDTDCTGVSGAFCAKGSCCGDGYYCTAIYDQRICANPAKRFARLGKRDGVVNWELRDGQNVTYIEDA